MSLTNVEQRTRVTSHGQHPVIGHHVLVETALTEPDGILAIPDRTPVRSAVLVLSGSSGRVETDRVRLLAVHGAAALSFRWFGDVGQPEDIREIPLETFAPAMNTRFPRSWTRRTSASVGTSRT